MDDFHSFTALGGFQKIDDFLRAEGMDDCAKERELAGFESRQAFAVGNDEAGSFCITVWGRSHKQPVKAHPYNFLAMVEVGGAGYYVALPTLPDLLEFMRQTVPLSIAIDDWTIRHEEWKAKIEKELVKK